MACLLLQENILLDPMFVVPGSDIVDVIIEKDVVLGKANATYIRHPQEPSAESYDTDSGMEDEGMTASNSRVM